MKGMVIVVPLREPQPAIVAAINNATGLGGAKIALPAQAPRDVNRNRIVQAFLDDPEAEWLLMLDADTVVPNDAARQLLAVGRPIVCGVQPLYLNGIAAVNVADELPARDHPVAWKSWWGWDAKAPPRRIAACGFGCVLMQRSVLADIGYPWFIEDYGDPRDGSNNVTEDIHFCRRAAECGYEIWVHPGVVCGHLKVLNMTQWIPAAQVGLTPIGEAPPLPAPAAVG